MSSYVHLKILNFSIPSSFITMQRKRLYRLGMLTSVVGSLSTCLTRRQQHWRQLGRQQQQQHQLTAAHSRHSRQRRAVPGGKEIWHTLPCVIVISLDPD